ncbi:MAG: HPr family phosphocarrier protein [Lachnospiraceae bacterium]|nr:HPr family phosphocarrier protein [Lachnospiraceae bacterium]MBR3036928.1 HPr family phosphocarrier protein [Lachnospiraceae bacterium]
MRERTVEVALDGGLDAYGIALCVQTASRFDSEIRLMDGVRRMNAKSIMGMMALGLALGDSVTVQANGPDEEEAANTVADFLEGK